MKPPPALVGGSGGRWSRDGTYFIQSASIPPSPSTPQDPSDLGLMLRRQRQAERLHALSPRPVYEALGAVAVGEPLDCVLSTYAALDPGVVRALGGDRFPVPPQHLIWRRP